MLFGVTHQLRGGIKTHGLAVQECGQKSIGVMALQPGADIHQQGKTRGMALRKAVLTKAFNLLEDAFGKFQLIALGHHAADQPFMKRAQAAFALPGGHGAAQLVGFTGCEVGGQDGQLHDLLLKDGHAQGARQRLAHFAARVVHRFFAAAAAQIGVHHAPLNGPGPHDGDFNHQVVKTARLQARQHAHLRAAFNLKSAHAVAFAQHLVGGRVFSRYLLHDEGLLRRAAQFVTHKIERTADGTEHAQGQQIDLQQTQRVEVVFVPLDDAAPGHGGVFNGHQAREVVARDDKTARVLRQVARKTDELLRQFHPQAAQA